MENTMEDSTEGKPSSDDGPKVNEESSNSPSENKEVLADTCPMSSSKESKPLDSTENSVKTSDSKDKSDKEDDLQKSDDELTEDGQKVSYFKKVESKVKKRNYRSQNNSSDIESNEQEKTIEKKSKDNKSSSDSAESSISDAAEGVDEADSTDTSGSDDDDDDEMPAVLQKEPSKSNYSILKDINNRQIGCNNFIPQRFYSSLHAVQRLELMSKLKEHNGCVNSLGFNQTGNLLASSSDDLTITIWDWAIGKKTLSLETGHRSNVFQSKWLPLDVENILVSSARDGQIRLIDIQAKTTRKIAQHRSPCHKISTHLDLPHFVLSAGEDSKVFSIDVRESKPTKLLSVHENDEEIELFSIHTNPLNNLEFCVAGRMRNVLVYDRRKPSDPLYRLCPMHLLSDDNAHITCAVYNHNGTEIVASYNNEDIYLFDVVSSYQGGDFAHKYQGHRNNATVKGVNFFGPNSEFVCSGSDCGNIFIWDKKTEAIVQFMAGDENGIVNVLEPHPHIPILATSGLDYDVKIWIPSCEETPDIKPKLQSCVKRNLAAKSRLARDVDSAFDGHLLWIMLRNVLGSDRDSDEYGSSDEDNHLDDDDDESSDD